MPGRRQGTPLANPEAHWFRDRVAQEVAEAEARRCLGEVHEAVLPLRGGLANTVLRVGEDRVLRIYRRDVTRIGLEATLLERRWQTFRVPRVVGRGQDFLLLEHVPHLPLADDVASGRDLGAALAEIHATRLPQHGFLDEALQVTGAMPDFLGALLEYRLADVQEAGRSRMSSYRNLEPALAAAWDTLSQHRRALEPAVAQPVLLHGDFKSSNLHRAKDGSLLVLDWEFAFAGPALCDIGQLMRWDPSPAFQDAFARAYRGGGGQLPPGWRRAAALLDLTNLMGLLMRGADDPRRVRELQRRIAATMGHRRASPARWRSR